MGGIGRISGKGQIFTMDVLLSLLPILMIIGAGLQYLYLTEEHSMSLVVNSRLETAVHSMADYVVSSYYAETSAASKAYINVSNCMKLRQVVQNSATKFLDADYAYRVTVEDYYYGVNSPICNTGSGGDRLWDCTGPTCGQQVLDLTNNTAASELRFLPAYDANEQIMPGHIAGVTFTVWEEI